MIYTTAERNKEILLIAEGKADLNNIALYERLESFNWISIKRTNNTIEAVELTYAGKELHRQLLKQMV